MPASSLPLRDGRATPEVRAEVRAARQARTRRRRRAGRFGTSLLAALACCALLLLAFGSIRAGLTRIEVAVVAGDIRTLRVFAPSIDGLLQVVPGVLFALLAALMLCGAAAGAVRAESPRRRRATEPLR